MRFAVAVPFIIALASVAGTPLDAQWLKHPTPGVPKTAAGTPRLDAPAPRAADGKPDLSGIWIPRQPVVPIGRLRHMKVGQQLPDMAWESRRAAVSVAGCGSRWIATASCAERSQLAVLPVGIVRHHAALPKGGGDACW
jgi:hypothetical protein